MFAAMLDTFATVCSVAECPFLMDEASVSAASAVTLSSRPE